MTISQLIHQPGEFRGAESAGREIEWLETDGLGGFASSNITTCPARRYHGLLVAPAPGTTTRHVFLAGYEAEVTTGLGTSFLPPGVASDQAGVWHQSFQLAPWPTTTFRQGPFELRREILMPKGHHAVLVRFSLITGPETTLPRAPRLDSDPVSLVLRPLLAFREADKLTFQNGALHDAVEDIPGGIRCRPYDSLPALALTFGVVSDWIFAADPIWRTGLRYAADLARGYDGHEDLFSPGGFRIGSLDQGVIVAATIEDPIEDPDALWLAENHRRRAIVTRAASSDGEALDLRGRCVVAADDFLYRGPGDRLGVIAGFPWFGEWGRDTFIALPGLTLARGRLDDCAEVLSGARAYLDDGLLPNIFGADKADSHYGSVDAALWFARAVLLYQRAGGDASRIRDDYLPALVEIAQAYRDGTAPRVAALGIGADDSMLIHAGTPELNPTWMDAVPSTGPVTPRHGCPVEICALWCSLLSHLAEFSTQRHWRAAAERAGESFLSRFWMSDRHHLADVWRAGEVDPSVRPNMVLAASLELSPLSVDQRAGVLRRTEADLLTPFGLRTLAPTDLDYVPCYRGGVEERDRAYHQGTVWPWLLGFYCEASLRVDDSDGNRARLRGLWDVFADELDRGGLNHISEVYDGDPPQRAGGTIAQAWNTAELVRAFALLDGSVPLGGGEAP